ncbi:uncharacterized protein KY384_001441 [Bacidia gigantensis]|uniref:uncharacterized protein n=1 Tax=Bacidia gigantensis TaxID=2732470 RepID=UPI001D0473F7|nr:uncharacterized protein KY384_001441 [Bacidia gigantensis]KAG8533700.1 hypothetical protein KY384_001441 [Bacidia gigantensis]
MDGSMTLRDRRNAAAGMTGIYLQGLIDRGIDQFRERNYEAALEYLDKAIQQDVEPPLAVLDKRAATHARLGDHEAAVADAGRMIRSDPRSAMGYLRLGQILQNQKKSEKALKIYERVNNQLTKLQTLQAAEHKLHASLTPGLLLDPLKVLPHELMLILFSYLDFVDIINTSRVCRVWRHAVGSNPDLWMNLDFSSAKRPINFKTVQNYIKRSAFKATRLSTSRAANDMQKTVCYVASRCRSLEEVTFNTPLVSESLSKAIPLLSNLRKLVLSPSSETSMSIFTEVLLRCPCLEHFVCIIDTRYGGSEVLDRLKELPVLETLSMSSKGPVRMQLEPKFFKKLQAVRNLSLRNWELWNSVAGEKFSFGIDSLQSLNLTSCNMRTFIGLPTSIRELYLNDWDYTAFNTPTNLPKLERLVMTGNHANLQSLQNLLDTKPDNLLYLDLSNNVVPREIFLRLLDAGCFDNLEMLVLNAVQFFQDERDYGRFAVDDRFVETLVHKLEHLKRFELAHSVVTGVSVKLLVNEMKETLEFLRLDRCPKVSKDAVDWARNQGVQVSYTFFEPLFGGKRIR